MCPLPLRVIVLLTEDRPLGPSVMLLMVVRVTSGGDLDDITPVILIVAGRTAPNGGVGVVDSGAPAGAVRQGAGS